MRALIVSSVAYAALAATVFVIVYHALARWWASAIGRNLMLLGFGCAGAFDLWLVFALLQTRPEWVRWVAVLFFLTVGTALWWRTALLVREQRKANPRSE